MTDKLKTMRVPALVINGAFDVSLELVQTSCSSNNEVLCEWDGLLTSVDLP